MLLQVLLTVPCITSYIITYLTDVFSIFQVDGPTTGGAYTRLKGGGVLTRGNFMVLW